MNVFKESPRDARSTTTGGIRARLTRTLSMALAVAITAILLPAAISLAKTGSFGAIPVVEAITGTSSSSGEDAGATHTKRRHSAPAAEQPAQPSDDPGTLTAADLPTLKDDKAVAARLFNGSHNRRSHQDETSTDDNGGTRHDPSGDDTSADDSTDPSDDSSADDSTDPSDDGTADQGSGDTADTTPADDNSQSSDDSGKRDDNPSSDDTSSDDHGKGNEGSGKKDTPKPPASPAPVATTPADSAPATTPDTSTDTTTADTTPASDVPADAAAAPADTRRQFTLDPTESASLIVDVPEGADHITLWAQAAGVECAPRVAVTVDGEPSDDFTLAGTDWQSHVITPVPDAGVHVVRVLSLGTDPQVGCADATQDVVTIAEPRVGTDGDNPPAGAATLAATDTSAITDASSATDSTATGTTDDGTADQGSGDAAGSTPSDSSTTTADDGTADQGTGDAAGTTPSDSSTTTTDDGTADQGSGDVTGDTSATTTDSRRQYSLYTRESVTLVADEAADGGKLTMWLRTSSEECQLRVIVSVDDRIQKIVGVNHADWQSETIDYQADGSTHRIAIGVLRPKGGNCTGTETLTIVEPTAGEEGAATPALPVTPAPAPADTRTMPALPVTPALAPAPADTTANPSTETSTPATTSNAANSAQNAHVEGTTVFEDAFDHASTCAAFEAAGWAQCHEASEDRLSIGGVGGRRAAIMHVADGDVAPLTPTVNPRAQLNSPIVSHEGDTQLITWGSWIGADFPTSPSWSVFAQWFASPYNGSPRMSFGVKGGRIGLDRDADYGSDRVWSMPLVREQWTDYALKVKWSSDPSVGWIELTVNGQQQKFADGQTRMYFATIKSTQGGRVETILTNYRVKGSASWATVAHSDLRVSKL